MAYGFTTIFRFSLKSVLLTTLLVALLTFYFVHREDWTIYAIWLLGCIVGWSLGRREFGKAIVRTGIGGSLSLLLVIPMPLVFELQAQGHPLSQYAVGELVRYFSWGLLILAILGFVAGACLALVLWPAWIAFRKYMSLVDEYQRPLLRNEKRAARDE